MKKFRCISMSLCIPIFYFFFFFIFLGLMIDSSITWVDSYGNSDPEGGFTVGIVFIPLCLCFAFYSLIPAARRVEIYSDHIVCKGLMPSDTIILDYEKCNVGMDWHAQNGNKIWWVYLCYGYAPTYKDKNPANRINAVKFRQGFIKIMYSEDVYLALMEVLPKKQKNMLMSARRFSDFEKQGNIVL